MRIWVGEDDSAGKFIVENSSLRRDRRFSPRRDILRIIPNNQKAFPQNPDFLREILYLDRPDVVVTDKDPERPILAIEFCAEAPSGHDILQRFGRVAAAAGSSVPFAFVFPERKWIRRQNRDGWDIYNPLIFKGLQQIGHFHQTPVLAFYFPSAEHAPPRQGKLLFDRRFRNLPDKRHPEMKQLFELVDLCVEYSKENKPLSEIIFEPLYTTRESWMWQRYAERCPNPENEEQWLPLLSCQTIRTTELATFITESTGVRNVVLNPTILSRPKTIIYSNDSQTFRSDPYGGTAVAVDYLRCRKGRKVADRHTNLAVMFRMAPVSDIEEKYQAFYEKRCPFREDYNELRHSSGGIPYLNLHLKEGCKFTKQKEIRQICAFADILIFRDGVIY